MKALSLRPEWALPVFLGAKSIECRTWKTDHRGPLLICSSSAKCPGTIAGHALCIVDLQAIEPFSPAHLDGALLLPEELPDNAYAWHIELIDWVEPFDVKGKLHLYDVDDDLIRVIPESVSSSDALDRYFEPLVYWGKDEQGSREWWSNATAHLRD